MKIHRKVKMIMHRKGKMVFEDCKYSEKCKYSYEQMQKIADKSEKMSFNSLKHH